MMEPEELSRFHRHIATMAVKADDAEGFAQLVELRQAMEAAVHDAARRLHGEDRMSWTELARPLGVTRQAVRQWFHRGAAA